MTQRPSEGRRRPWWKRSKADADDQGGSDEYKVTGADVTELIDWVSSKRGGRSWVLYACVPRGGLGLVRLAGTDRTTRADPRLMSNRRGLADAVC